MDPMAEQVRDDMVDLVGQMRTHGPRYAKEYLRWATGQRSTPPNAPPTLNPYVAKAIRESAMDSALFHGAMAGGRAR